MISNSLEFGSWKQQFLLVLLRLNRVLPGVMYCENFGEHLSSLFRLIVAEAAVSRISQDRQKCLQLLLKCSQHKFKIAPIPY